MDTLMDDWRKDPLSNLGLMSPVTELFEAMNVTTIGGVILLRSAIEESAAVWPGGIGPAMSGDICKRLDDYIGKHQEQGRRN